MEFGDEGGRRRRFLNVERVRRRTFSLGDESDKLDRIGMSENFLWRFKGKSNRSRSVVRV